MPGNQPNNIYGEAIQVFNLSTINPSISESAPNSQNSRHQIPANTNHFRLDVEGTVFVKFGDSSVVADSNSMRIKNIIEYLGVPRGVTHIDIFTPSTSYFNLSWGEYY